MVSPSVLKRLAEAVSDLEARSRVGLAIIQCPDTMDWDEVSSRHYWLFPDDAAAKVTVHLVRYSEEIAPGQAKTSHSAAWRDLKEGRDVTRK